EKIQQGPQRGRIPALVWRHSEADAPNLGGTEKPSGGCFMFGRQCNRVVRILSVLTVEVSLNALKTVAYMLAPALLRRAHENYMDRELFHGYRHFQPAGFG